MAKKRRKPDAGESEPTASGAFEIVLAPDAVAALKRFRAYEQAQIRNALEHYLRHEPTRVSKARIKRLRGLTRPQFRLRVGDDVRVFYDVTENRVEVLAILSKQDVEEWLEEKGVSE